MFRLVRKEKTIFKKNRENKQKINSTPKFKYVN